MREGTFSKPSKDHRISIYIHHVIPRGEGRWKIKRKFVAYGLH